MKNKEQKISEPDYIRPRCKILIRLPFGIFIAKYVKIELREGCKAQIKPKKIVDTLSRKDIEEFAKELNSLLNKYASKETEN